MKWKIQSHESAIILEINSNKANLHNPAFFQDFNEALDQVDQAYPHKPLILTAPGKIFSAGIDFSYCFDLFERADQKEIENWFEAYRGMMLRLFTAPRLTVAAINGHTFAGGMILALCCDFRIAARGDFKYSINEVPVGVPMPSIYTEIIRFRLGNYAATETILSGEVYAAEAAIDLHLIQKTVEAKDLISAALKQTQIISPHAYLAYRHSKKMLQAPVLRAIQEISSSLEPETIKNICAPDSVKAQRAAFAKLQKTSARS